MSKVCYKYIGFNIFSSRILIVLYKMLTIIGISNEKKPNELTMQGISWWNVTIFYRQELISLFQVQEKLKACGNSKFSSSCFIANDDSLVKIVLLHVIVFSEHDILHFWDNVYLLKYCPMKVPQNCFKYFSSSNQTYIQVSKFSFTPDK